MYDLPPDIKTAQVSSARLSSLRFSSASERAEWNILPVFKNIPLLPLLKKYPNTACINKITQFCLYLQNNDRRWHISRR